MVARNNGNIAEIRMLSREQAAEYTGLGLQSCREWCDSIGATYKFSERLVRFDKRVIDAALDKAKGG